MKRVLLVAGIVAAGGVLWSWLGTPAGALCESGGTHGESNCAQWVGDFEGPVSFRMGAVEIDLSGLGGQRGLYTPVAGHCTTVCHRDFLGQTICETHCF
jgi:hypothetical protein